jgi:hypothetical protein
MANKLQNMLDALDHDQLAKMIEEILEFHKTGILEAGMFKTFCYRWGTATKQPTSMLMRECENQVVLLAAKRWLNIYRRKHGE